MRLPPSNQIPPGAVLICKTADGAVVVAQRSGEPAGWGTLTVRMENGVPHLLWTGTGSWQLQTSLDGTNWENAGGCRTGPEDIAVTPRDNGCAEMFRVVPCAAEEAPEP